MPRICYVPRKFSADSRALIDQANTIIAEYTAAGFVLTLRQLYYQFVSRDIIANTSQEYKRLGSIINDARLAGLIDWETMEDRTRNLQANNHWSSPADIVSACAAQFRYDLWADQKVRVEVWIEKDALSGVFDGVCRELDCPYFSCRGYTSQSEMWAAARRIEGHIRKGQAVVVLHFGDHDPSGIDMSRDIADRLKLFVLHDLAARETRGADYQAKYLHTKYGLTRDFLTVDRIALNYDQVEAYGPPPNPAKMTDSRAEDYVDTYGAESWELDALEPNVLVQLVRDRVEELRDSDLWEASVERQQEARELLGRVAEWWDDVAEDLS